jgi:amidase
VSAVEEIRAALARLDAAAGLGAVVARDDASALAEAAALDELPDARRGPLHGRAVTIKDWIEVAGLPCEGEARERTGHVPSVDATVVTRLRAAGAVVVAKTQPGVQHPIHGRCHHPFDADRTPGGSSSGEAALLGAGASTLGLGSDSGGSIRLPAAWCGVFGCKPSFGLVPDTGHLPRVGPHEDGRTVIGPMARSAADLATVLRVIAGPDGVDSGCVPVALGRPADVRPEELRVTVVDGEGPWQPAPSTAVAVRRAADTLVALGATLVDEVLPAHLEEALDITQRSWDRSSLRGVDADRQLRDWDRFARRMTRATASFDVVLSPVVADVAPPMRPPAGEDYVFTLPWSLTGWPSISVPAGPDPATGLPLAVQVAAARWHDHIALGVAAWLDAAWSRV